MMAQGVGRARQVLLACAVLAALAWAARPYVYPGAIGAWVHTLARGGTLESAGRAYTGAVADADVTTLINLPRNAPLKAFIELDNRYTPPAAQVEPLRLHWADTRSQRLYEGCRETGYIDPALPETRVDVTVPFDAAAARAIEEHFGCPMPFPEVWGRSDLAHAQPALRKRVDDALGLRGIASKGDVIGVDYASLIEKSTPHLAGIVPLVLRAFPRVPNQAARPAEVLALVSLVQRGVPYGTIPPHAGWEKGGIRSPLVTLRDGGDCDSKCVLLAALLRVADPRLPIVLITTRGGGPPGTAEGTNHMLVGLGIPATACDVTLRAGANTYVIVETTDGWGIGVAPEGFDMAQVEDIIEVPSMPGAAGPGVR